MDDAGGAYRAVAIAASTGGIDALRRLLADLRPGLPMAVMVLLHTSSEDVESLCEVLQWRCPLPVRPAQARAAALPGRVYVAPSNYHLLVERDGRFSLSVDEKVHYVRPSADVLFESAADAWGSALIGVVLTGANDDGARGLRLLRQRGGCAIVQAPSDAEMPVMPESALKLAGADHVLPLAAIGPCLNELSRQGREQAH